MPHLQLLGRSRSVNALIPQPSLESLKIVLANELLHHIPPMPTAIFTFYGLFPDLACWLWSQVLRLPRMFCRFQAMSLRRILTMILLRSSA